MEDKKHKGGFRDTPAEATHDKDFNEEQDAAVRQLANSLHRLNEAVVKAVQSGITVELLRTSRYHNEAGNWGDQITPVIKL
jgi:hypothetical protein